MSTAHGLLLSAVLVAAEEGHWRPRWAHRRQRRRRERLEGRRRVHHVSARDGQQRLDARDLVVRNRQIVGGQYRQVGVLARREPPLDVLLTAEPRAAVRVQAQGFLA